MVLAEVQADCFRIPGKIQGQFIDSADAVRFRIRIIIRRVFIENSRDRLQGIRHISTETTPGQCFRIFRMEDIRVKTDHCPGFQGRPFQRQGVHDDRTGRSGNLLTDRNRHGFQIGDRERDGCSFEQGGSVWDWRMVIPVRDGLLQIRIRMILKEGYTAVHRRNLHPQDGIGQSAGRLLLHPGEGSGTVRRFR